MRWFLMLAIAVLTAFVAAAEKPRVIVLTDITNEPDDEESLVRYLVYANEFDTEGLIATTSVWLRDRCGRRTSGWARPPPKIPRPGPPCCRAPWAHLPGRKPKLPSENVGSKIGWRTWSKACWIRRSSTVGIPSVRTPLPPGLGISTFRTGWG